MIKWIMRTIYVLLIVGSLALHIGIVMVDSVAQIASNVVGRVIASTAIKTVVDTKTVYSKQKNKIIALSDDIKDKNNKITALSDDIKDKNNKLKIAKNNLTNADNRIIKQSDEITKLGGKVTNLKSDLALKNKELKSAKSVMTAQDSEIIKLGEKVQKLQSKPIKTPPLIKSSEKLKNLADIENASNFVIGKSLGMVSRNTLALPAQAIPFIGIAVIVGVTYWDVRASCDIVEELENLKKELKLHVEDKTDEKEFCGISRTELWKSIKQSPKNSWKAAKELVPELPDFSNAWDATKEWVSPTYWGTWFTGWFTGWFGEDSPAPEQIPEDIIESY